MPNEIVVGAQWGDEGKGKIVDKLAASADLVVRYGGGANAGHTLVIDGRKIILHLVPSSVPRSGALCAVGPMVACDMDVLPLELALAEQCGSRVLLDSQAPVVLPIHKALDAGREEASAGQAIGTTKRGIGDVFGDYWARQCLRLGDLTDPDRVRTALLRRGWYAEKLAIARHYGLCVESLDQTVDWAVSFGDLVKPLLTDCRQLVTHHLGLNSRILFEGAQGVLLDLVHGTAPYQTASICTPAGVSASFGIYQPDTVAGVFKAYCTRVGEGPFPTELLGPEGEQLRQKGYEFGSTTGRLRRCGWLDLPALRFACRMAGITHLAMTKLDVLGDLDEIRFADGYQVNGQPVDPNASLTSELMNEVSPMMSACPGFRQDISGCRSFDDLPPEATNYVRRVEKAVGLPIRWIGVGADRDELIDRSPLG